MLSFLRTAPKGTAPVVVAINMSAQPQTITLDLAGTGVTGSHTKTLAATDAPAKWPVAIAILCGTVVGDGIGATLGWGDSAILTGLAAALVA